MAKAKKSKTSSFSFKHTAHVKVELLPFHPLPSLKYLDAEALGHAAKTKIEVGSFKSDCCDRHVRAVIEGGKVIGLEVDQCPDSKPAPPDLVPVLRAALKKARLKAPGKWKPIPIAAFLAQPQEEPVGTITCIEICIWGHCLVCCTTQIPDTPFWCGNRVIVQRDP
jgi:hypothetical protein